MRLNGQIKIGHFDLLVDECGGHCEDVQILYLKKCCPKIQMLNGRSKDKKFVKN